MKQSIINSFLHPFLSNYKTYRKWIGGEWRRRYIDYAYNDIWFLKSDPIPMYTRGTTYYEDYRKETITFNQLKVGKLYQIVSGYESIIITNENGEGIGFVKLNDPLLYLGFYDNGTVETDWGQLFTSEHKFLTQDGVVGYIITESEVRFIAAEII